MHIIKNNKEKIIGLILLILSIPYMYIIINAIFQFGRLLGNYTRLKIG